MTSKTPKDPGGAKLEGSDKVAQLHIDPNGGKGEYRRFGGSKHDEWNQALITQIVGAMPRSAGAITAESAGASQGLIAGQMDLNPQDPAEAMLTAQMIAANAAALDLYRRAWITDQSFEVRTKYLALADKAARTVAIMADTLDRHQWAPGTRGRGWEEKIQSTPYTGPCTRRPAARRAQNGRANRAGRLQLRVIKSVGCTALAVAHQRARRMATTKPGALPPRSSRQAVMCRR